MKWYRAGVRVAVYSQLLPYRSAEAGLAGRARLGLQDDTAQLTIQPVVLQDQGQYRCEVT